MSVGISESALSRELSRNANDDGYGAESAHALASQRRVTATKFSKTDERHMPIIKKGLLLDWSPENISFRMKVEVPTSHSATPLFITVLLLTKCMEALCIRIYPAEALQRW
ncbi:MAG: hypothetical protein QS721_05935 [Candidatus Endonucleobacter sp. (ex Gigantidas childressi)]|nr:hypothetical protein [Candidatus Endonucleobacter sp. (ex Gigantidas childressi)]